LKKLNRKIPPPVHGVENIAVPPPVVHYLDNGIQVVETRMGTQPVLKLEICFRAGRAAEHKRTVAYAATRLLRDGTTSKNSKEIAEILDFYAGTFATHPGWDTSAVTLFCLTKHFEALIPVVADMIHNPVYPQHELDTFADKNIRELQVDLTQSDTLAYRKLTELLFGENMPYGYSSVAEDYKALTTNDLKRFHQEQLTTDNCVIFIGGAVDSNILSLLNQYMGQPKSIGIKSKNILCTENYPKTAVHTKNETGLQTSIRMGRRFGSKLNPDYAGASVLNLILGGYFGSRLMKNVREDKGFTYNISSSLDFMQHDGYWYIGTEVGTKLTQKALDEIYKEMELLQTEFVGEQELEMVRNYCLGNMLNMIDGAFAIMDTVKPFFLEDLKEDVLQKLVHTIQHITPAEIQNLAKKYLNQADWLQVTVG
jgi:zinc protease